MELFDIRQAALGLRISPITLRRLIHAKQIGFTRIGKKYLFTQEIIDGYIRQQTVEPTARATV